MSSLAPRRRRPGRRARRGVALIIAVVAITLLTVVATDFAYNTRVDLQLATNQRDELRAHYLAQSGIGMSRLLLRFQKQLNNIQLPSIPGLGGGAGGGGLNLQIWKMARVDCQMLQGMVQSNETGPREELAPQNVVSGFDEEFPEVANKQKLKSFGGFEGCFLSTIEDEEAKINVMSLAHVGQAPRTAVNGLLELWSNPNYQFLFERADANGDKVTPQDLVIALRDWVDDNETQSALNPDPNALPFVDGFSGESNGYDRYEPRYKPKNARFDSLDELYRVYGVNDRFMAAFRNRLTVYSNPAKGLNVNADDTTVLIAAILTVFQNPQAVMAQPVVLQEIINALRLQRQFSVMGMSVKDFVATVQQVAGNRFPIKPALANAQANSNNGPLTDKSETYSITSVGEAGSVQKTIHAVVRLDDSLGKLLYWREE
jgi:general secretion pathway protein K